MPREHRFRTEKRLRPQLTLSLIGFLLACATPSLPPPAETPRALTSQTVQRTRALYLYSERLDQRFIIGALDALETRFHTIRFDEQGRNGILWVGANRAVVPLGDNLGPDDYPTVLTQALDFIDANLKEKIPDNPDADLELVALRGGLAALDRYSTIIAGSGTDNFKIRFSGKLKGIGARIGRRKGQLIAIKVFEDSPAQKGGLKDNDAIIRVDGDPTQPLEVTEAVERIRGEEGSTVVLGIERDEKAMRLSIVRGEVRIPSVESKALGDGIGYTRISTVTQSTPDEFREQITAFGNLKGLVLDLRGNTGGSMQAASTLADYFLADDTIVRVVHRRDPDSRGPRSRSMATPDVLVTSPVVVLVDRNTASAAEILSGAIAPLEHTTIVGETSFGKGLIQRLVPLPNNKLLKLTVAEYLLSGDRVIHQKGVEPSIKIQPISSRHLGALADLAADVIPYVVVPDEENEFPIDLAKRMLLESEDEALTATRSNTLADINERLQEFGIALPTGTAELPDSLPKALDVEAAAVELESGRPARLRIRVSNPNSFSINDAWAATDSPAEYLSNKLIQLGTLEAKSSVEVDIELSPPPGISVDEQVVMVHVASGLRALQSHRLLLNVVNHVPDLNIVVTRVDDSDVKVTVKNVGVFGSGPVRVSLRGSIEDIESLKEGESKTVQLSISGKAEKIAVDLMGPGVRRRIEVPFPDGEISIIPPMLSVARSGLPGFRRVRLKAESSDGFSVGWIALDGQKEIYADWAGVAEVELETPLGDGDHSVAVMVESISGVAVTEWRRFITN